MKKIITIMLLSIVTTLSSAEIIVIGNLENEVTLLTKKQVQAIFMGRTRSFSNGIKTLPFDVAGLRAEFYQKLTDRPIEQINAYWARLTFSGQSSPPKIKADQQAVINAVIKNKQGISYIESEQLNEEQVKVLFVLEAIKAE
jgi:ABC-type phosphate transport system substrate-binding protein